MDTSDNYDPATGTKPEISNSIEMRFVLEYFNKSTEGIDVAQK